MRIKIDNFDINFTIGFDYNFQNFYFNSYNFVSKSFESLSLFNLIKM